MNGPGSSGIQEPVAPAAPAGELEHVIGALTAPRVAFASIARRPTWLLALALLTALGAVAVWASYAKVDAGEFLSYLEASGRPLPAGISGDQILGWTRVSSVVGAAIFAPLTYLAVAGLFLVSLRLFGAELDFRRSLAVTLHGFLPFALAAIVGLGLASFREEISMRELESGSLVPTHLGVFLSEDAGAMARALASSVDLFSAWCIGLLGLGFTIVARVSAGKAYGVVGGIWALGILLKLTMAALR